MVVRRVSENGPALRIELTESPDRSFYTVEIKGPSACVDMGLVTGIHTRFEEGELIAKFTIPTTLCSPLTKALVGMSTEQGAHV